MGVQSSVTVWEPGTQPLPANARKKIGPAAATAAARSGSSASFSKTTGSRVAVRSLETVTGARAPRTNCGRVLPLCASARRIATTGEAEPHPEEWLLIEWPKRRIRTDQILAIHPAGQTSLKDLVKMAKHRWIIERDYRGTQAGTGTGSLRRTRLARISPSRHTVHRGLWVPCGRAEPFFPLSPRRQSWTISPRAAAGLPAARLIASDPSVIIRTRSQHSER